MKLRIRSTENPKEARMLLGGHNVTVELNDDDISRYVRRLELTVDPQEVVAVVMEMYVTELDVETLDIPTEKVVKRLDPGQPKRGTLARKNRR